MSSPEKRRKPSPTPQSMTPNPSLPDDLVLSCLARVSRLYYPTLSLVSKSFRSLLASPELYKIRSSLDRTESCLYVCLQDGDYDPNPRWFTLCRKPNRTLTNDLVEKKKKKKSNAYALAAIPVLHSRPKGLVYKPKEGRWKRLEWDMDLGWVWYSYCVVENVLYYYYEGDFKWYDTKVRLWKNLKGVKGLPRFARCGGKMVDYGGKMAIFWDKIVTSNGCKNKMILCAVIALERRNSEEIWGRSSGMTQCLQFPCHIKGCMLFPLPFDE